MTTKQALRFSAKGSCCVRVASVELAPAFAAFCRAAQQPDRLGRIEPDHLGQLGKLDRADDLLPCLDMAHVILTAPQPHRDVDLPQACFFPRRHKELPQRLMSRIADCSSHWSPETCSYSPRFLYTDRAHTTIPRITSHNSASFDAPARRSKPLDNRPHA